MKILFSILGYINIAVAGVVSLIASPLITVIFLNIVIYKYLLSKPDDEEEFKQYCWDMYVANCTERSDEGEGLITFLEYSESNKDFLKYKFTRK